MESVEINTTALTMSAGERQGRLPLGWESGGDDRHHDAIR